MKTAVVWWRTPDGEGHSKEVRLKSAQEHAAIALRNAERATQFGSVDVLRKECEEWRADGARCGAGEPHDWRYAETAYAHAWRAVKAARRTRAGHYSFLYEQEAWRAAFWAAKCAGHEEAEA